MQSLIKNVLHLPSPCTFLTMTIKTFESSEQVLQKPTKTIADTWREKLNNLTSSFAH